MRNLSKFTVQTISWAGMGEGRNHVKFTGRIFRGLREISIVQAEPHYGCGGTCLGVALGEKS
jgi:hypothetical protein